ncbi:hypothetical protein ACQKL5_15695 [Peribacillus sp. NPDC097675]
MKTDKKNKHFELLERVKPAESSDRKRMSEFIKKMKTNAENSQLTSKNS